MNTEDKLLSDKEIVAAAMIREHGRDLNKAVNISIASLVGAIIPVIGLLLAIVALVIGGGVPKNTHTEAKKNTVRMIAIIGIGLSLIAGGLYYIYFNNLQKQAEAENQAQAQQIQREKDAKNYQQMLLDNCLQNTEDAYWNYVKVNATDATPQADGTTLYTANTLVWDTADKNRTTAKDECYRRYPVQ